MKHKGATVGGRWVSTGLRGSLCVALLSASSTASAQEATPPASAPNLQHRGENGELLKHSPSAVSVAVTYNSDANANVDGGASRGAAYLQRIGLIADADLAPLIGWQGASAHVSVHLINGTGLSGSRVGNLLTVSGLEAEPAARLFNLWIEQKLGQALTLRVGQFTAAQEFAISPTATLFVNSTFGWPASFATDLPSGGPAYPLAAPGIRLAVATSDGLAVRFAVFAGDPAGPGAAAPQRRDLHGLNSFRFAGKSFFIGEVSHGAPGDDPAWTVTVGGWAHSGDFSDLQLDDRYIPLASPSSTGTPLEHRGNWSAYAMADGRLWHSGPSSLRSFLRVTASPADRNPMDLYLDGGLSLSAPFRGREKDVIGIAFAIGRLSPQLRSQARDRAPLAQGSLRAPDYEMVVEASWQLKMNSRAYLQPNVQVVVHPSAALLASGPSSRMPSRAVIVGLRSSLRF